VTRCDLRGCADSAGVSDSLPTGESRTHNPLVLGSNPSGPTNQTIEATAVRKISAIQWWALIGRLKLFSQLFEACWAEQAASKESGIARVNSPEARLTLRFLPLTCDIRSVRIEFEKQK
jgi:hypothetical protein